MKYMLVYRPNAADVFQVSRLACSPERRVASLAFSGSWDHAYAFAAAMLEQRHSVATAHANRDGYVGADYWSWGAGDPDRKAVESRKRDRDDVAEGGRQKVEARSAASPLGRGTVIGDECRVDPSDYRAYLASPRWAEKRRVAIRRAGNRCQTCNARAPLDVHHRTYERLGDELPSDIVALCRKCHDIFHANTRIS